MWHEYLQNIDWSSFIRPIYISLFVKLDEAIFKRSWRGGPLYQILKSNNIRRAYLGFLKKPGWVPVHHTSPQRIGETRVGPNPYGSYVSFLQKGVAPRVLPPVEVPRKTSPFGGLVAQNWAKNIETNGFWTQNKRSTLECFDFDLFQDEVICLDYKCRDASSCTVASRPAAGPCPTSAHVALGHVEIESWMTSTYFLAEDEWKSGNKIAEFIALKEWINVSFQKGYWGMMFTICHPLTHGNPDCLTCHPRICFMICRQYSRTKIIQSMHDR